jgi:hypothetical protein
MLLLRAALVLLASAVAVACSPALDWREFQPENSGLVVAFPCKPDRHQRAVMLAGRSLEMRMLTCSADDLRFVLIHADVAAPGDVSGALAELRTLAIGNLAGGVAERAPLQVPGMTPNDEASRIRFAGRLPDGKVRQQQAAFFARGLRVYQASVIGERFDAEAVEPFFAALRLPS